MDTDFILYYRAMSGNTVNWEHKYKEQISLPKWRVDNLF